MSEKTGEPRQMHHGILTWAHRSDSPRKIRMRGDQVGPADPLGQPNMAGLPSRCTSTWRAPTPPDHLPYMLLAGTDPEDYKRGPPSISHTHTISYVKEKSREALPFVLLA